MGLRSVLFLSVSVLAAGAAQAASCSDLVNVSLAGGRITSAEQFAGGSMAIPGPMPGMTSSVNGLPSFCKVAAVMKPSPESDIKVEIWLPDAAAWNGKFLGTGNGGFAGSISTGDLISGVMRHYATANTDMGTSAAKGYEGGRGHREMIGATGPRTR
jgi:feruloyl esterase